MKVCLFSNQCSVLENTSTIIWKVNRMRNLHKKLLLLIVCKSAPAASHGFPGISWEIAFSFCCQDMLNNFYSIFYIYIHIYPVYGFLSFLCPYGCCVIIIVPVVVVMLGVIIHLSFIATPYIISSSPLKVPYSLMLTLVHFCLTDRL